MISGTLALAAWLLLGTVGDEFGFGEEVRCKDEVLIARPIRVVRSEGRWAENERECFGVVDWVVEMCGRVVCDGEDGVEARCTQDWSMVLKVLLTAWLGDTGILKE